MHININSVLSKIDELRILAQRSKAAVIGVTESKLDETVSNGEININGYNAVRSDRNRHGGGVLCYIRDDLSFSMRSGFSEDIENVVFDLLLPNTRPIFIGILYRPPNQIGFLEKFDNAIQNIDNFHNQEVYILGDLNINLVNSNNLDPNTSQRKYRELCRQHSLKQLINTPTRITVQTSTILDHILTNSENKVSESGVID